MRTPTHDLDRTDVSQEREPRLAPLVGRNGRDFDRSILLNLSAVLSQESRQYQVKAEAEPDPELKKSLLDSQQHLDGLRYRAAAMLSRKYFKSNGHPSKNS